MTSPEPQLTSARPTRHARIWPWALAAIVLLPYLAWAGSNEDPRQVALWRFTKPGGINGGGWLVPAPGLGHVLIAAALLYAVVSVMAFHVLWRRRALEKWKSIGGVGVPLVILMGAFGARVLMLRGWWPMALEPEVLGAKGFDPAVLTRWPGVLAEMGTIGLLIVAQVGQRRSMWLAAVYAFHPLALIAVANGTWLVWAALTAAFVGAMGWRLRPWVTRVITLGVAVGCVWWTARLGFSESPFNGLLHELTAGMESQARGVLLVGVAMLLQAAVVALATWREWDLPRTVAHLLVAWALTSPRVMPADILPLLALLPLAWSRAGWVLSGTVLLTYGIVWSWKPTATWLLPAWLVYVMMMPVWVAALWEWGAAALQTGRSAGATPPANAPSGSPRGAPAATI